MILEGPNAVQAARQIIGATNAARGRPGLDPRRLRDRGAPQPRPRLGLGGVRRARRSHLLRVARCREPRLRRRSSSPAARRSGGRSSSSCGIAFEVLATDVEEIDGRRPRRGRARQRAGQGARRGARSGPARRSSASTPSSRSTARSSASRPPRQAARDDAETALRTDARGRQRARAARPGNPQVVHEVTKVTFRELSDELVERYVRTLEWSGRAGGYAIQGQGAGLVRAISGNYLNVVGLPVAALLDLDLSLMLRQD